MFGWPDWHPWSSCTVSSSCARLTPATPQPLQEKSGGAGCCAALCGISDRCRVATAPPQPCAKGVGSDNDISAPPAGAFVVAAAAPPGRDLGVSALKRISWDFPLSREERRSYAARLEYDDSSTAVVQSCPFDKGSAITQVSWADELSALATRISRRSKTCKPRHHDCEAADVKLRQKRQDRFKSEKGESCKFKRKLSAEQRKLNTFLEVNGFSSVNTRKKIETTTSYPLHLAIQQKDADLVRTLLANRADPNLMNSAHTTPLQLARRLSKRSHGSAEAVVLQALLASRAEGAHELASISS